MFALFKFMYFIGFLFLFSLIAGLLAIAAMPAFYLLQAGWMPVEHPFASVFLLCLSGVMTLTLAMFVNVAFMRLVALLFPIREGRFSIYGFQMAVWSIQYLLMNLMNTWFLPVFRTTPLMNLFYRALGMKIGRNAFFNSSFLYEPHLIEIGDNSRVGENAVLVPHTTEGKDFICARIRIGKNVTIGQYAQILPGASIGDNVIIGAGAIVPKGKVIESNSIYGGNPLQFIRAKNAPRQVAETGREDIQTVLQTRESVKV